MLTAGSAACFADLMTFPLDTVKVALIINYLIINCIIIQVRQQVQTDVVMSGDGLMAQRRGVLSTAVNIARLRY